MNLNERFLTMALYGADWVLALLVLMSLASIAVMLERALVYRAIARREEALFRVAVQASHRADHAPVRHLANTVDTPGARMLERVLRSAEHGGTELPTVLELARAHEKTRLDQRLGVLGTIAANAPFVGLFGTVLEILRVFHELGQRGMGSDSGSAAVMTGLSEALVATGVGLLVAIPASVAYTALLRRSTALLSAAQDTASLAFGAEAGV